MDPSKLNTAQIRDLIKKSGLKDSQMVWVLCKQCGVRHYSKVHYLLNPKWQCSFRCECKFFRLMIDLKAWKGTTKCSKELLSAATDMK